MRILMVVALLSVLSYSQVTKTYHKLYLPTDSATFFNVTADSLRFNHFTTNGLSDSSNGLLYYSTALHNLKVWPGATFAAVNESYGLKIPYLLLGEYPKQAEYYNGELKFGTNALVYSTDGLLQIRANKLSGLMSNDSILQYEYADIDVADIDSLQIGNNANPLKIKPYYDGAVWITGFYLGDSRVLEAYRYGAYFDFTFNGPVGINISPSGFSFRVKGKSRFDSLLIAPVANIDSLVEGLKIGGAITMGTSTVSETATPLILNTGNTYADDTTPAKAKLKLFDGGDEVHGIGVSSGQTNYYTASTGTHVFYTGSTRMFTIGSTGMVVSGPATASSFVASDTVSIGNSTKGILKTLTYVFGGLYKSFKTVFDGVTWADVSRTGSTLDSYMAGSFTFTNKVTINKSSPGSDALTVGGNTKVDSNFVFGAPFSGTPNRCVYSSEQQVDYANSATDTCWILNTYGTNNAIVFPTGFFDNGRKAVIRCIYGGCASGSISRSYSINGGAWSSATIITNLNTDGGVRELTYEIFKASNSLVYIFAKTTAGGVGATGNASGISMNPTSDQVSIKLFIVATDYKYNYSSTLEVVDGVN